MENTYPFTSDEMFDVISYENLSVVTGVFSMANAHLHKKFRAYDNFQMELSVEQVKMIDELRSNNHGDDYLFGEPSFTDVDKTAQLFQHLPSFDDDGITRDEVITFYRGEISPKTMLTLAGVGMRNGDPLVEVGLFCSFTGGRVGLFHIRQDKSDPNLPVLLNPVEYGFDGDEYPKDPYWPLYLKNIRVIALTTADPDRVRNYARSLEQD